MDLRPEQWRPRPTDDPAGGSGSESVAGGQLSARAPCGTASEATSLTREWSARARIHVVVRCQSTRLKILCSGPYSHLVTSELDHPDDHPDDRTGAVQSRRDRRCTPT